MANYYGTARSNYFPFLPDRLHLLQKIFGPEHIQVVHHLSEPLIAIISLEERGTPSVSIDTEEREDALYELGVDNADNVDDLDIRDILFTLLPPGATLVWVETGSEKARYVVGFAARYDHTGAVLQHIDLNDIYKNGEHRAAY